MHWHRSSSNTKIKQTRFIAFLVSNQNQNPHNSLLLNYLTETFNFSERRAQSLSFRYGHINSLDKSQSVVHFLQKLGFSQTLIQSSVRSTPQILFSDIDKTLKPKIEFFQQLGLVGSHLCKFLSKNSVLLAVSLEIRLIPNVEILRKILANNKRNKDLVKVLTRSRWALSRDPKRRFLSNIEYLDSCGIVGSQLSALLKRQPSLFIMEECKLRELVSRTLSLGFSVNSRMSVHGLYSVSFMSKETFEIKIQLLSSFGFSKDECIGMFRGPTLFLSRSEETLKLKVDFFSYMMVIKKEFLLRSPECLMYSIEHRVIP